MMTAELILENVAISNALQLEVTRATLALSSFNYDAMPSLKLLNLSIAVLQRFCCWYITLRCDLDLWHLTLNMCSVSPVTWWNSVPNLNAIEQYAPELLRFQ